MVDLADAVRSLPLDASDARAWQQLVHDALADMLTEMLTLWSEVSRIEAALSGKAKLAPALARTVSETRAFPLNPDIDHAARIAAGILVTYALLCGLWYATGWHQGANAVLFST
ncbi:FUSC family protein, partial [Sphingobium terrigena]